MRYRINVKPGSERSAGHHPLEEEIREKTDRLRAKWPRIGNCRVVIEQPQRSHHIRTYRARIALRVPGATLVSGGLGNDAFQALGGAFDAATRRVEQHSSRKRARRGRRD